MESLLNSFNSGYILVNSKRDITFCNEHVLNLTAYKKEEFYQLKLNKLFTKASLIFIDSYIYPILINDFFAEELQLTMITKEGKRFPVVANIKLDEKNNTTYWSFFCCNNRDKLYQELIQTKELLEKQGKELLKMATIDPLTGLLNRRELDNQVTKILSHAKRTKSSVALMVIDIDFFKNINDSFGHAFGDEVLIALAQVLLKKHRPHDIIARFGGEEFIIVFSDVSKQNALKLAEDIRMDIQTSKIKGTKITVSIGISMTKENNYDFDILFKEADNALYSAKNKGRNTTIVY